MFGHWAECRTKDCQTKVQNHQSDRDTQVTRWRESDEFQNHLQAILFFQIYLNKVVRIVSMCVCLMFQGLNVCRFGPRISKTGFQMLPNYTRC